ncbi:flagellar basal-body MS-ring/collar protein FliF [Jannaschia sp. Os4]|uniref:flagellar basal-body MS-ring/collar protein FliF n=1 Tax=Jannaschia sp. Os4 TaxID=2807617 RepID=UPI0031B59CDF
MLVTLMAIAVGAVLAPTYAPLYSGLSPAAAGGMVSALEQAGFDVEVSGDGGTLSVPREDVARARMTLATAGLLAEGAPGWELFDDADGLGMNTFLQRVNRLRALEGELARSIQTIDGITAARVHLVLPEREAFSRERPEATASVIVRSRPGATVSERQAIAIRALVASAVPDLAPGRITVLSGAGETILGPGDEAVAGAGGALQGRKSALEERLRANVQRLLAARVGAGSARVEVNVDLSSVRQITQSEAFDPDGRVVRSTETRAETSRDQDGARDEVGVAGNLPAPLGAPGGGGGATSERDRSDEVVNYEIGSTRTETVSEPGAVARISVAVLVDEMGEPDGAGGMAYTPRTTEEMERLAALVRAAIGFDAERGDRVSVETMRFAPADPVPGLEGGSDLVRLMVGLVPSALRGLFAVAVVALVLRLGLRPALAALAPPPPEAVDPGSAAPAAPDLPDRPADEPVPSRVDVPGVAGPVERTALERARDLALERPDEATRAIRGWLAAGT